MPNLILHDRQRERVRARPRPNSPGNYVTASMFAQWYFLTYGKSEKHYIHDVEAKPVYSKVIGYFDNPVPNPAWKLLQSGGNPAQAVYPSTPQTPPRVNPPGVTQPPAPVITVGGRPGQAGFLIVGTLPVQLYRTVQPIKRVTVLADPANALTVWTGYDRSIAPDRCFPLSPGAARDYDIDDLSQLWLVGENATDQVFFIFEV